MDDRWREAVPEDVPPELTAVQLPGYVEESRDYWPTLLDRLAAQQS